MSNVDFPSGTTGISRNYSKIERITNRPTIRSRFESGYEQTRDKFTRTVLEWKVTWNSMSVTPSYNRLERFFTLTAVGGASSWIWNDPIAIGGSGATYEVRFIEDKLKFLQTQKGWMSGSISFREV